MEVCFQLIDCDKTHILMERLTARTVSVFITISYVNVKNVSCEDHGCWLLVVDDYGIRIIISNEPYRFTSRFSN